MIPEVVMSCMRLSSVDRISEEDRRRFLEEGFAVVHGLVDAESLAELRRAYEDVVTRRVAARGDRLLGGLIRQVKHPSKDHPGFASNPAIAAGLRLARLLFQSDDLVKAYDMIIDKPPFTEHATPWHQDVGYFGKPVAPAGTTSRFPDVQFWVALDPCDVENGCMQFVPTPYGSPSLPHRVASGDPEDEGRLIEIDGAFDASRAVACPLEAGDATLHLVGTPHYTGPNRTARPRRAYIFNVGPVAFAGMAETELERAWGASARL